MGDAGWYALCLGWVGVNQRNIQLHSRADSALSIGPFQEFRTIKDVDQRVTLILSLNLSPLGSVLVGVAWVDVKVTVALQRSGSRWGRQQMATSLARMDIQWPKLVGNGEEATMKRTLVVGVVVVGAMAVTGCSGGSVKTQPVAKRSATTTESPTATVDPRAQPALAAYTALLAATNAAESRPIKKGKPYPPNEDFSRYSFDPFRSEYEIYIISLADSDTVVKGRPPKSHPQVVSVDLSRKPWPMIILTDCDTGGHRQSFDSRSGKLLPPASTAGGSVPPPYLQTVTMIKYQGHWGVQNVALNMKQTCTG